MTTGPRKSVTITLNPVNLQKLDAMAEQAGCSRSALVEVLLLNAISATDIMDRVMRDASAAAAITRAVVDPSVLRAFADSMESRAAIAGAAAAQGTLFKRRKGNP